MFVPKWARRPHNLGRFPSWDPCITPGYWAWYLNALPTSGSLIRSFFYAYILAFFAPPPPLSDENPVMLHFFAYAEIIFAHILVFPACAIEVQHTNENSPTTLHVHYAFPYISLPSLHDYNVKLPQFHVLSRTGTKDNNFLFLFLNFDAVL